MLNVFLTVDTEIWPFSTDWPVESLASAPSDLAADMSFYIYGNTGKGAFGVPFQLACLEEHGLKANYFVESLFAGAVGLKPLKDIVSLIQDRGQEVQLHAHTEWLREIRDPTLPDHFRQYLRQFSEAAQSAIVGRAAANLRSAGANNLCAFRAGSFGANFDTLRVLNTHGFKFDLSHNTSLLNAECALDTGYLIVQPQMVEGVHEFPMSCFLDYPGHYRHAQLAACSIGEITEALLGAWRAGWYAFVILLHGSELLGPRKGRGEPAAPDMIVVRRFRKLCEFLADNRDKFRTSVFSEIESGRIPQSRAFAPLKSGVHRTAWRIAEQLVRRVL